MDARTRTEIEQVLDRMEQVLLDAEGSAEPSALEPLMAELWAMRRWVPFVVADRLAEGRAPVAAFEFDLLAGFAGGHTRRHLRRIYDDRSAADLPRWAARRRAPWPTRGEAKARLAFLDSLRDADRALLDALEVATSTTPPDPSVLQEILAYLGAMPHDRARRLVDRALELSNESVVWLLRGVLHLPDAALQRQSVDALLDRRDRGASGALARLAATARDADVRAAADAAARRLQGADLAVGDDGAPEGDVDAAWPTLESIYASEIDGDGGQMVVLVRAWPGGFRLLVQVFHKDGWGLKDVYGFAHETDQDLPRSIVQQVGERGIHLMEVSLPLARGILAHAVSRNAATGHPVPPAFEVWAPFFHDTFPPLPHEAIIAAELDDAPFAGRSDLVKRSARLLEHPLFDAWFFNPDEVGPLMSRYAPPQTGKLTPAAYAWFVSELAVEPVLDRMRGRLRRQARLLDVMGDRGARDLALATSASLAAPGAQLGRHPFLKAMVDRSVLNAALSQLSTLLR